MKKFTLFTLILFLLNLNFASAEIINNTLKTTKTFDVWNVICEEDVMMDKVECKIAAKFYEKNATIYVQPYNKIANQVVTIIPIVLEGSFVKIRIDKNAIIWSDNISKKDFGVIPFSSERQKMLLEQMKQAKNMFIRFTIYDKDLVNKNKELTEKISLSQFNKMLSYYDFKMNK